MTNEELAQLAGRVADQSMRAGRTLATAESCTGGWIAKCLTDIPGSSEWFRGGVVSYSNEMKARLLGVPEDLIAKEGAVSEAVARAMAEGALRACGADCAVAVTGVAGPEGGSAGKPVGTVWLAWAARDRQTRSLLQSFDGDREAVRRAAAACALQGLLA
ncbi:MAG: CinA family protein [Gammaproteobacteria bacterium]|nr:CinA family protein [Gammaproteobacteria bacterium]